MFNKALTLTILMLATPAMAGDLSYSFVEGRYQQIDIDDDFAGGIDGDGLGVGFAFELGESFFVTGSYSQADLDTDFGFSADYDETELGLGYHAGLSDNTDFYGVLSWVKAEASIDGFGSASEDGYGMTIGVRSLLGEKVELEGHLAYVDLGDDDGVGFGGAAYYEFTKSFALGAQVDFDEDVTIWGVGARLYFGR